MWRLFDYSAKKERKNITGKKVSILILKRSFLNQQKITIIKSTKPNEFHRFKNRVLNLYFHHSLYSSSLLFLGPGTLFMSFAFYFVWSVIKTLVYKASRSYKTTLASAALAKLIKILKV